MNWFAIHTRRFREAIAASSLVALGLEVFLPMVQTQRLQPIANRSEAKPLFPSYFFARFRPIASLASVECARGVLHVVKSGCAPVAVEDLVVTELRKRVEADGLIRLQRLELKPGDRVSVHEGPFAGMIGRVDAELDDRKRVAILLEALWNARVVIDRKWIEAEAA